MKVTRIGHYTFPKSVMLDNGQTFYIRSTSPVYCGECRTQTTSGKLVKQPREDIAILRFCTNCYIVRLIQPGEGK